MRTGRGETRGERGWSAGGGEAKERERERERAAVGPLLPTPSVPHHHRARSCPPRLLPTHALHPPSPPSPPNSYANDVASLLRRRFDQSGMTVGFEDKEDLDLPNHLAGHLRRYLKLSFHNVGDLMDVSDTTPHYCTLHDTTRHAGPQSELAPPSSSLHPRPHPNHPLTLTLTRTLTSPHTPRSARSFSRSSPRTRPTLANSPPTLGMRACVALRAGRRRQTLGAVSQGSVGQRTPLRTTHRKTSFSSSSTCEVSEGGREGGSERLGVSE